MSIDISGGGRSLSMHSSSWRAVQDIARQFGCTLEYQSRTDEERGEWDFGEYVLESSARAFAKALYKAIHAIETDRASKRLVKLARMAGVANLRDVADCAVLGHLYVD
jgi:hypothetical protein